MQRAAVLDGQTQEPPTGSSPLQIVHRIVQLRVAKDGTILINTQGDANTARDPWTLTIRGDVAYRVRWSVPLLGYVAVAFQDHRGPLLLVAGLVLLAVAAASLLKPRAEPRSIRRRR